MLSRPVDFDDGAPDLAPLIMHPEPLPAAFRGAAIAIGNFDGVHRGHGAVLAACAGRGLKVGVLTFEPHPREVLRPGEPPFRLALMPARRRRLKAAGADFVYALPFTRDFAATPPERFIGDVLEEALDARHIAVGSDFCFGHQRRGNPALLSETLSARGVGVSCMAKLTDGEGNAISSSAIRAHLMAGRPELAAALLGDAWEIEGEVMSGDRRGRTIGFPTANIPLGGHLRPAFGVYAVSVGPLPAAAGAASGFLPGVANIGVRPTVGGEEPRLEAHLFDFSSDLYGRVLRVRLHAFLRPEQRFASLDALKAQIAADADAARSALAGLADRGAGLP